MASSVVASGSAPCGPSRPRKLDDEPSGVPLGLVLVSRRCSRPGSRGTGPGRGSRSPRGATRCRRCAACPRLSARASRTREEDRSGTARRASSSQIAHSGPPRAGARRPAHDLAALDGCDHRLGEVLIDAYSAKKRSSTAPSRKMPLPSKARSSNVTVISMPRAASKPSRWRSRRDDRAAVDAAHAADAALGRDVGEIGEQRQDLAQRRRASCGAVGRTGRDG